MNDAERRVLRIHHTTLLETLDTTFLIPILYEKGVDFQKNCFDNELARPERVKNMLMSLKDICSFDLFVECLRHEDSYTFIADILEKELANVDNCNGTVHNQRKVNLFTDRRQIVSNFRHKMKRCSHEKDFNTFRECYFKAIGDWEYVNKNRSQFNHQQRQKAADFCHAAYDAELERRRVFYENIPLTGDVLDEVRRMCAHTSLPIVSNTVFLGRYSSALVMADRSLEEGLTYIEDAEHMMELLPACKETGFVLYLKFNLLMLRHERDRTMINKEKLSQLGNKAIAHFSAESDTISNDLKRVFLLKKAQTCLDMGVFLNVVGDFEVEDVHIHEAERLLIEIHRPELWERMELRAKLVYTAIKSRLAQLSDPERPAEAIKLAKKALRLAKQGGFSKQRDAINYNLSLLYRVQNALSEKYKERLRRKIPV